LSRRKTEGRRSRDTALEDRLVPEVSRFFGIIIRMFAEMGAQHHVPHFHAYDREEAGIFSVDPVEMIAGSFPRRAGLHCTKTN
jgi:uncharacterized protein DUF4160